MYVWLYLADNTTGSSIGWNAFRFANSPQVFYGSTADWIIEATAYNNVRQPLANYGSATVVFPLAQDANGNWDSPANPRSGQEIDYTMYGPTSGMTDSLARWDGTQPGIAYNWVNAY